MSVGEQISLSDLGIWCGRMSLEHSQAENQAEKILESSLRKPQESSIVTPLFLDCRTDRVGLIPEPLWETTGLSLGEFTMHSFGELPSVAVESHLWQILEDKPHPKYNLSEKACLGVLNRSKKKGRELPPILEEVLIQQSHSKSEQVATGGG